jgi:hypothetical protein
MTIAVGHVASGYLYAGRSPMGQPSMHGACRSGLVVDRGGVGGHHAVGHRELDRRETRLLLRVAIRLADELDELVGHAALARDERRPAAVGELEPAQGYAIGVGEGARRKRSVGRRDRGRGGAGHGVSTDARSVSSSASRSRARASDSGSVSGSA